MISEQQKQSLLCGISTVCVNSVSLLNPSCLAGYGKHCLVVMGSVVLHLKVQMKLGKPVPGNWKSLKIRISLSGNPYLSSKKLKSSVTCLEVWLAWKLFSSSAILACKLCIGSGHKFKVFLSKSVVGLVCLFVYGKLCSLVLLVIYPHLLESVFPNCNRFSAIKRCKQF